MAQPPGRCPGPGWTRGSTRPRRRNTGSTNRLTVCHASRPQNRNRLDRAVPSPYRAISASAKTRTSRGRRSRSKWASKSSTPDGDHAGGPDQGGQDPAHGHAEEDGRTGHKGPGHEQVEVPGALLPVELGRHHPHDVHPEGDRRPAHDHVGGVALRVPEGPVDVDEGDRAEGRHQGLVQQPRLSRREPMDPGVGPARRRPQEQLGPARGSPDVHGIGGLSRISTNTSSRVGSTRSMATTREPAAASAATSTDMSPPGPVRPAVAPQVTRRRPGADRARPSQSGAGIGPPDPVRWWRSPPAAAGAGSSQARMAPRSMMATRSQSSSASAR